MPQKSLSDQAFLINLARPLFGVYIRAAPANHRKVDMSVAIGRDFENEVCKYLENIGYEIVGQNEWVKVSSKVKPYECDIHAIAKTSRRNTARLLILALAIGGLYFLSNPIYQDTGKVLLFGAAIGLGLYLKKYRVSFGHVWVECKNRRSKVNRTDVVKLRECTDLLFNFREGEWKPEYIFIFSSSGFEQDALHFAKEYKIDCYERSGNKFRRVRYLSPATV